MITTLVALLLAAIGPGQQPQLAHDGNRTFLVVARDHQIAVMRSADAGRTFSPASSITISAAMAAGMHRGPRVAVTGTVVLVAAIVGAQGGGKDGDVVLYRSTDEGTTWSAPVVVNDVPAAAREGLHGMAATPSGLVVITWLDLREKGTRLYGAVSRDHGATWSPDALVYASPDETICQCCHPSVAVDEEAGVAVMFRNHIAGSRDMYVSRSTDGSTFAPAEKQGTGTWKIDACPMDGGGLTLRQSGVTSVWRREGDIFLTMPGVPERRLGVGRDPVIGAAGPTSGPTSGAASGAAAAPTPGPATAATTRAATGPDVAWTTPDGIMLQRGTATRLLGPGKSAALLAFPTHTLLAWEQQGQVVTQVVPR